MFTLVGYGYMYSWGVRGDNTPEYAKYLGYLDVKDLYPNLKGISYETFLKEILDGKMKKPYEDRADHISSMLAQGSKLIS